MLIRFSAVDIAIFAAAFAVLYDKATGASDAVFRKILGENKAAKIDLEDVLTQVNSASAEALAFSGLLSDLREDLVKEAGKSYAESFLVKQASSVQTDSLKYEDEPTLELSDILGTGVSDLQINSTVAEDGKNQRATLKKWWKCKRLQKNSLKLCEIICSRIRIL